MRRSFSSTWNARWSETGAAILYFVIRPQETLAVSCYVLHMRVDMYTIILFAFAPPCCLVSRRQNRWRRAL